MACDPRCSGCENGILNSMGRFSDTRPIACDSSRSHELRGRPRLQRILPAAAWYFTSLVYGFSAQSAEKPYTDKRKYRSAEGKNSRPRKSWKSLKHHAGEAAIHRQRCAGHEIAGA